MSETIRTPANLVPYVDALGVDGAIRFFEEFGGAELYVARHPQTRSRVVALVGREAAERLGEMVDRLPRRVPLAKRWIAEIYRSRGLSTAEIARRLRASDVAVRGWLKAAHERRQLLLF